MFEIDLPELEFIAADLVSRPVLHGKGDSSAVSGRIKIGRPEARVITAQSVSDEAAQRFLRDQASDKRYTLVAFAANFYPGDDPFEKGKVTVLLQSPDAAEPPVARCLAPMRSVSPVEQVTKVTVEADPLAVERILTTLMRNAVKFAPESGEVSIGAAAFADEVCFTVKDNGPGIAAEDIARLGRPFEQGSAVMANGMKGSGLGLAIANSLVELHGGTLSLRSRPGKGATALVTLPRVQRGRRAIAMARVA